MTVPNDAGAGKKARALRAGGTMMLTGLVVIGGVLIVAALVIVPAVVLGLIDRSYDDIRE